MISNVNGRSYTYSNVYDRKHPKGEWRISVAPEGRRWFMGNEDVVWTGAEGEDSQDNGEPPRAVCEAIVALLGFDHFDFPEPTFNIVELAADGDECAFDQPCAYGHRVEDHAVYCHNERWLFAPRKCRRHRNDHWIWGDAWPHEGCAGFLANPRFSDGAPTRQDGTDEKSTI